MVLLERPGGVVTREELRQRLWKSQEFVEFDQGLNTAMMRLRHALDDTADTPRFIETLPRRGYRFIAPVTFSNGTTVAEKTSPEAAPEERKGWLGETADLAPVGQGSHRARPRCRRACIIATLGVFAVALLTIGFASGRLHALLGSLTGVGALPTVAVLPFDSLSSDPAQNFLAESLTEQLITELGKHRDLRIVSRGTVMQYAGKHSPLDVLAKELHADDVLEGSVSESGGRLRVTANLYQVATGKHLWAETYERAVDDSFSPQREIVLEMTRNIQANLASH